MRPLDAECPSHPGAVVRAKLPLFERTISAFKLVHEPCMRTNPVWNQPSEEVIDHGLNHLRKRRRRIALMHTQ